MSNLTETLAKHEALMASYTETEKQLADGFVTVIKDLAMTVFEADPKFTEAKWVQYTPWFNDGDECVFSVHDIEYIYNDNEYWNIDDIPMLAEHQIALRKLEEIICNTPISIMKNVFGEHSCITITKSGIDIDEYEHD